jgi:hypothetical protein
VMAAFVFGGQMRPFLVPVCQSVPSADQHLRVLRPGE